MSMKYTKNIKILSRSRKIGIGVILILIFLIVYKLSILSHHHIPEHSTKIVEVQKLVLQDIQQKVEFIGTVRSKQQANLMAKARGVLDWVVSPIQEVKKGELIAKIEN